MSQHAYKKTAESGTLLLKWNFHHTPTLGCNNTTAFPSSYMRMHHAVVTHLGSAYPEEHLDWRRTKASMTGRPERMQIGHFRISRSGHRRSDFGDFCPTRPTAKPRCPRGVRDVRRPALALGGAEEAAVVEEADKTTKVPLFAKVPLLARNGYSCMVADPCYERPRG